MSMESQSKNMDTKSENGLPLSVGRATGQDLSPALAKSERFAEWIARKFGPEQTGVSPVAYEQMREAWEAASPSLPSDYINAAHISASDLPHIVVRKLDAAAIRTRRATQAEVRNNDAGKLDEFIAHNADVHLEQMNDGHWWLGITMPDGVFWHLNFTTKRNTRIDCFAESERHV